MIDNWIKVANGSIALAEIVTNKTDTFNETVPKFHLQ